MRPAYRDLIQNALYGRSDEVLKLLCEDEIAEGILEGIFDFLLPQERIKWESVHIGRDTGASEFPMHARSLAKFGQIQDTVFILDGDQRGEEVEGGIREALDRTWRKYFRDTVPYPGSEFTREQWVSRQEVGMPAPPEQIHASRLEIDSQGICPT